MSSVESDRSRGNRFQSFSRSLKHDEPTLEENFKIGDFSSKSFTRRASLQNSQKQNEDTINVNVVSDSPNVHRIEGGFEETTTDVDTKKSISNRESSRSNKDLASLFSRAKSPADSPTRPVVLNPEVNLQHPDTNTLDVVGRHLVGDAGSIVSRDTDRDEEFDSLQLQGGDISREIYNWRRDHSPDKTNQRRRTHSFTGSVSGSVLEPDFQVHDIRVPGGFRRSFLVQKASRARLIDGESSTPTFFTRNFIEFLTLYGHFAGEELRDDEDEDEDEEETEDDGDEESLLLPREIPRRRGDRHKASTLKAVLLLLKAFIGTGVLFLPKGFANGGWLFCTVCLIGFSALSFWCFLLLINTRVAQGSSSYGDLGQALCGPQIRYSILASIVFSQIGFAAAYIVFIATNLKAFTLSIFGRDWSIETFIFLQLLVFIPLSLIRKIAKLSGTALIADLFILLGLIYVYYYCIFVTTTHGVASVKPFNEDWTVFIGTAIFTYEGIGLLIPIQESMKQPSKFPKLLFWVMFTVTFVFVSAGLVGYLAFGEKTDTVILLNFPQDSPFVSIAQFLYAIAILLSTPLQLFPAIRILENGLFERSGKYNDRIKWRKNYFRCFLVTFTALIGWAGASNLDKFVSFIGSFACIPLIYVYPPLLHYNLQSSSSFMKKFDLGIITFGMIMMLYTSGQTLRDWFV